MHAEAVLLIDNGECEVVESNIFLKQCMSSDQEIDVAEHQPVEDSLALAAAIAAGEQRDANAGGFSQRCDGREVLARQNLGRRRRSRPSRPASITDAAAISATTVLPEPTSPCSSRSMR